MKSVPIMFLCLAFLGIIGLVEAKTVDEYIQEAEKHQKSGYLQAAAQTMEGAVQEFPESSDAHAYLGLYLGMRAGQTNDMMEAVELVKRCFEVLDKSVALDEQNLLARHHRGLMGIQVPEFFGKLDMAIEDLEFIIEVAEKNPGQFSMDQLLSAYDLVAAGYQKKGHMEKARTAWERIIDLAPSSDLAKGAEGHIDDLGDLKARQAKIDNEKRPQSATVTKLKEETFKDPQNPSLLVELGRAYLEEDNIEQAEQTFKKAIGSDPSTVAAHKLLAQTLSEKASEGYDQRIYENTNFRTNIAFELSRVLDQAVDLAPDDIELRLWRGISGVEMPFFVQKLDQGIDDLNMVIQSDAPNSLKAEALYWLGVAYRKKGATSWIEVVSKHSDSPAAQRVFDALNPGVKRPDLSEYQTPVVIVEFVLGFQDELAPQTAVWIEDADGNFVKTLYISGFAGYVKERQITLPIWTNSSNFVDVDAVTGASINLGHHIYVWNLKDYSGNEVKSGFYTVKVEVSHWPSMQYQLAQGAIEVGKKERQTVVEEGNFIPYLEVTYYPEN